MTEHNEFRPDLSGGETFGLQLRGYNRRQVDEHLAQARSHERLLVEQRAQLAEEAKQLRQQLAAAGQAGTSPTVGPVGENGDAQPAEGGEPRVFRIGGISYVRIPALDVRRSAAFYQAVFGWHLRGDPDRPSFDDGTGHVIGHWITDLPVAGEAGVLPYVYVEDVDQTLEKVTACGGEMVRAPYPEGDLWVATLRDPAGNVLGVWHRGPRIPPAGPPGAP